MYDTFLALFDKSLVVLALTPPDPTDTLKVIVYAIVNTTIRAVTLAGFTYGAIRVVITAVSHGSF